MLFHDTELSFTTGEEIADDRPFGEIAEGVFQMGDVGPEVQTVDNNLPLVPVQRNEGHAFRMTRSCGDKKDVMELGVRRQQDVVVFSKRFRDPDGMQSARSAYNPSFHAEEKASEEEIADGDKTHGTPGDFSVQPVIGGRRRRNLRTGGALGHFRV